MVPLSRVRPSRGDLDVADVFACRHCLQLAYESQREAPHYRALRKAQGIHEKLGGTGIIDDPVFKPKGMHWRTYAEAESRAVPPWLLRLDHYARMNRTTLFLSSDFASCPTTV